jgi:hypothetical protein
MYKGVVGGSLTEQMALSWGLYEEQRGRAVKQRIQHEPHLKSRKELQVFREQKDLHDSKYMTEVETQATQRCWDKELIFY